MTDRRSRSAPGRPSAGTRPGNRAPRSRPSVPAAAAAERRTTVPRPRLTGRAGVLILVLVVLAVSYASSLRAFLQQRAHIAAVKEQIWETEAGIKELEKEKRRWQDDAYVRMMARQRLNFVDPNTRVYQVIDENGEPLGPPETLRDPEDVVPTTPTPWWDTAWESVELAGTPPSATTQSPPRIVPPKEQQ